MNHYDFFVFVPSGLSQHRTEVFRIMSHEDRFTDQEFAQLFCLASW
jgi:hypothetical protein